MNSDDVLRVMHRLLMKYGKPECIRSDNGGEFVAEHLQKMAQKGWRQANPNLPRQSLGKRLQ